MAKNESKNENKVKKHFFKDFKAELKKVIWPTPKQLVNNTIAVVTIVLLTAVIVFILDFGFDILNKYGISNVQKIVNEKFNSEEENNSDNTTNNEENNGEEGNSEENANPENTGSENTEQPDENPEGTEQTPENTEQPVEQNPEQPAEGEQPNTEQ